LTRHALMGNRTLAALTISIPLFLLARVG
jgi:hypothetical protein